jgi:hypothetical protein
MAQVIWIDDVPHRKRRGKLVPIPDEWFGKTVSHQAKGRRYSKCQIKKIESRQDRAQEKAAIERGEEPHPKLRSKRKTRWYGTSGRVDQHRNKYRNERRASHPSKET